MLQAIEIQKDIFESKIVIQIPKFCSRISEQRRNVYDSIIIIVEGNHS
jgi:hypothetical protein